MPTREQGEGLYFAQTELANCVLVQLFYLIVFRTGAACKYYLIPVKILALSLWA